MNNEEKILAMLERMDQRLGNLEDGQAKLEADVAAIKGDVAEIKSDIKYLWEDVTRVSDRLSAQEKISERKII